MYSKKYIPLYVHIPFCVSKCDYCDFFSVPCNSVPEEYIAALKNETAWLKNNLALSGWQTLYIGGGTPSLLTPDQLKEIFTELKKDGGLDNCKEITIEMNPESVSEEFIEAAFDSGVTRFSLGVQSFKEDTLKCVHRACNSKKAFEGLEKVYAFIKKNDSKRHIALNLDFIAGLPEQTDKEFLDGLKTLLSYNPEHVSLYTLTIEEGTPLYKRTDSGEAFDYDSADRQWLSGADLLRKNGFIQYEVSNFCKPGFKSVHNTAYWEQSDYAGAGAGAYGTLYGFNGEEGLRWCNLTDVKRYTEYWCELSGGHIPRETETLSSETEEFEFLMMGLRTLEGCSSLEYKKRFFKLEPWGGNIAKRLGEGKSDGLWERYKKRGLCHVLELPSGDKKYALTEKGLLFLNQFLREL